jgi:hypothetical protein
MRHLDSPLTGLGAVAISRNFAHPRWKHNSANFANAREFREMLLSGFETIVLVHMPEGFVSTEFFPAQLSAKMQ